MIGDVAPLSACTRSNVRSLYNVNRRCRMETRRLMTYIIHTTAYAAACEFVHQMDDFHVQALSPHISNRRDTQIYFPRAFFF